LKLPPLEYASPRSIGEAIKLLAQYDGEAKIISGGQSLMPLLAFRLASPKLLVDLRRIPDLDNILITEQGIEIGAKVRWRDIDSDRRLREVHPLIAAAIKHVAHYQIRNRGTVGGSLAHADPAAEMPAIAVTCEADIIAAGPGGRRTILAEDFFVAPLTTTLDPCEIILAMRLPTWPRGRRYAFEEFARRRGDFALAGIALFYDHAGGSITDAHIGAFGVSDVPMRLKPAEDALNGKTPNKETFQRAVNVAIDCVDPRSDIHADGDYRRALLGTLLSRALLRAAR
jgi:aerobic carbon-monoxide dehydrogenase medium subunit